MLQSYMKGFLKKKMYKAFCDLVHTPPSEEEVEWMQALSEIEIL